MHQRFPFVNFEPGESPLILDMPHSAIPHPKDFDHYPEAILEVVRFKSEAVQRTLNLGVDHAVPFITGFHERVHDARVWTTFPRVLLDLNRASEEVDALSVEGSPEGAHAHGLIWRGTVATGINLNASSEEVQERRKRKWRIF